MKSGRTRKRSSKLTAARRDFARWRKRRRRGEHIPKELWRAAVELAGELGISKTSTELRLDYYSLKKQVARAEGVARAAAPRASGFVEIPVAAIAAAAECVVELDQPSGGKMRIHLRGSFATELAAAIGAFTKS